MLSVLVAHSARSVIRHEGRRIVLFPNTVRSLRHAANRSGVSCELIVADWPEHEPSTRARLGRWLDVVAADLPHRVVSFYGPFNKGLCLNALARGLPADRQHLLFLDADMLVPDELLTRGLAHLAAGRAWFAGYLATRENGTLSPPRTPGCGNVFMTRRQFDALLAERGGWPENRTWGRFDQPVADWFEARGWSAEPRRDRSIVPGFVHQWHPKLIGWQRPAEPQEKVA